MGGKTHHSYKFGLLVLTTYSKRRCVISGFGATSRNIVIATDREVDGVELIVPENTVLLSSSYKKELICKDCPIPSAGKGANVVAVMTFSLAAWKI